MCHYLQLSPLLVNIIWIGALFAAATSINSILMGLSRDVYKGSLDGLFPKILAKVHPTRETPIMAIIAVGSLSMLGVLIGSNIIQYAQVAVLGLMVTQILISIAVLRMPTVLPKQYHLSQFKLGPKSLLFFSMGSILVSLIFIALLVVQSPITGGVCMLFLLVGSLYYYITQKVIAKNMHE